MKLNSITWILLTAMVVLFGFAGAQQMELISIQEPQVTPLPSPVYIPDPIPNPGPISIPDCPSFSPPYCPDGELVAQPASPDGCTSPPICVTPEEPSADNISVLVPEDQSETDMGIVIVGLLIGAIAIVTYIKKR